MIDPQVQILIKMVGVLDVKSNTTVKVRGIPFSRYLCLSNVLSLLIESMIKKHSVQKDSGRSEALYARIR